MMKRLIFTGLVACTLMASEAQQLRTPQPSPAQTIKQDFGVGSIELSYSRPSVKGRKIFGDIVPFGEVWRTGANGATTLTFSDDVTIGGTKVPAGKYGIVSIPNKDNWTLIITKQLDITSPAAYKQENDVVRVQVKPVKVNTPTETFTMQFANIKPASADLQIMWDKLMVTLPITTDVESKVMAQIDNLKKAGNLPYFQAAMFYLENGKDLNQAMEWFDKAVEAQPNAFWVHHQRANALSKLGRKDEARQAAQKSMELARQQKNMDYVRLNEKLISSLK